MNKKLFMPLLLAALTVGQSALAQTEESDQDYLTRQVKTLSADEFGGRKPMGPYEQKTINYIADQMKELGLQPANGDSYFQPVRVISTITTVKGGKLSVKAPKGKVDLKSFDDVVIWTNRNAAKVDVPTSEFVFCGFGIDAPEYGWNDFEGLDVKGKIILAMVNDPGYYNDDLLRGKNMTYYGRWTYKLEQAQRMGAAGCLVIHNTAAASYGFDVCQNSHSGTEIALLDSEDNAHSMAMNGWITEDATRRLFKACGRDYDEAAAAAKQKGFKGYSLKATTKATLNVKVEIGETHNVAGILPGTDLNDQYVVFTAHWDHLGIGIPFEGDSIYNGASDNAAGVAAMLMHARQFAKSPFKTRRSLVFVAVTSEECGLLGSEWYGKHPLYPLEKTAANINIDGGVPGEPTRDVVLRAAGKTDLELIAQTAAAAQQRVFRTVTADPGGGYYRTDMFNFVRFGVPGIMVGGGSDYIDTEYHAWKMQQPRYYHHPKDEWSADWRMDGAMQNQALIHSIALQVANQDEMPKWYPNADFQRK